MIDDWAARRTYRWCDWSLADLMAAKGETTVSLVMPARNEAATVGAQVSRVREALMETVELLDEIVVIDSDSTDDTVAVASDAGAVVHRAVDIRPDLGWRAGKGEAMWKSQFVTTGELMVFMDADLLDWDTHFVPGLLGPLLTQPSVSLVKGFYERPFLDGSEVPSYDGGRVTELVARPLIALLFPELAGLVQPLAGEWAVRRSWFAQLSVPTGYAVELAALIDTLRGQGLDAIAQVDLGRRAHSHQALLDLGAMATQILAAVSSRVSSSAASAVSGASVDLRQYARDDSGAVGPRTRSVEIGERPPLVSLLQEGAS
ncbi:glucosyl-3-phosphoglycerate synthase [Nocardioides jensenii]|uniref:glucosyl-3-phosphoglycerate synthase n=1 Tax=Nocardioides jensenii TaxID=1843 RepID=UPI00082AFA18|nr:glucosyl-3-phosphoglycerate synthase [Nocardioides jensenii]